MGNNLLVIKSNLNISQVKEYINRLKEQSVQVTLALGRNKFVSFSGKLSGVYPALFTVLPFDKSYNGRTSYSYSEFMCGRVRIKKAEAPKEGS